MNRRLEQKDIKYVKAQTFIAYWRQPVKSLVFK